MKILIEGKVVHGRKYGRKLGYPTANMDGRAGRKVQKEIKAGVYAGRVRRKKDKKLYRAAIMTLPRPNKKELQVEAYLMNFKGNLYGERLEFEFTKFIRPFRHFAGHKELSSQIKRDIKKILGVLS